MTTPMRINFTLPSPCVRECPRRKGGCQIGCKEWAEYVALRDEQYARQDAERVQYIHTPSRERRYRQKLRRGRKGGRYGNSGM